MDDPLDNAPGNPEGSRDELPNQAPEFAPSQGRAEEQPACYAAEESLVQPAVPDVQEVARRRSIRQNLFLLLTLTLAAFALTAWILVRVPSPFGIISTGPRDVVRAQLQALDRGELRTAYNMFSARYRQEVPFDQWNELIVTHWRMFHADVVRAGEQTQSGPRVMLEIHLRGADDKGYRARFTLIRLEGRWWVDDLHWSREADENGTFRI